MHKMYTMRSHWKTRSRCPGGGGSCWRDSGRSPDLGAATSRGYTRCQCTDMCTPNVRPTVLWFWELISFCLWNVRWKHYETESTYVNFFSLLSSLSLGWTVADWQRLGAADSSGSKGRQAQLETPETSTWHSLIGDVESDVTPVKLRVSRTDFWKFPTERAKAKAFQSDLIRAHASWCKGWETALFAAHSAWCFLFLHVSSILLYWYDPQKVLNIPGTTSCSLQNVRGTKCVISRVSMAAAESSTAAMMRFSGIRALRVLLFGALRASISGGCRPWCLQVFCITVSSGQDWGLESEPDVWTCLNVLWFASVVWRFHGEFHVCIRHCDHCDQDIDLALGAVHISPPIKLRSISFQ